MMGIIKNVKKEFLLIILIILITFTIACTNQSAKKESTIKLTEQEREYLRLKREIVHSQ